MEKENSRVLSRYMKARTIPNDAERQRALNQQRFPGRNYNLGSITERPQNSEDYKNEATQTINPVTGRAYEDFGRNGDNQEQSIANRRVEERLLANKSLLIKNVNSIPRNPSDLEFFNYQLALARKDARDRGYSIYSLLLENSSTVDVNRINRVICILEEAGLPLTSINTASGLNNAIECLELEEARKYVKKFSGDINRDLYKIMDLPPKKIYSESNLLEIMNPLRNKPIEKYPSKKPKVSQEDRDKWLN